MANSKYFFNLNSLHTRYLLAFAVGCIIGIKVVPVPAVAIGYILLAAVCIFKCVRGDVEGFFSLVPYFIYTEIFMRAFARWIPYLGVPYLLIACFAILFFTTNRLKKPHTSALSFLIIFTFLEVVNNIYPNKPTITRPIIVQSFALLLPVIWASYNVLKPVTINKLLDNLKVASVYLSGIVFVAHLTGKINYGLYSNSESSNGLAPVQLSGYLGLGCVLFFLSIMNPEEIKNRMVNIVVLALSATVMVLTFSRGGLYFLGAVVVLFLWFNRAQLGNYARLLLFVPIALGVYMYVNDQTEGRIVDRYEQEGTSNRDILVNIGFKLFQDNMWFGVGTGNYNTEIVKQNLFKEESGAHNEYVRAAAEHGLLGIFFYWGFHVFLFIEIWKRNRLQRQYALYFLLLFFLIIVHNGLKIGIQPLLLMLAVGTPSLFLKNQRNVYNKELEERRVA